MSEVAKFTIAEEAAVRRAVGRARIGLLPALRGRDEQALPRRWLVWPGIRPPEGVAALSLVPPVGDLRSQAGYAKLGDVGSPSPVSECDARHLVRPLFVRFHLRGPPRGLRCGGAYCTGRIL